MLPVSGVDASKWLASRRLLAASQSELKGRARAFCAEFTDVSKKARNSKCLRVNRH